MNFDLPTLHLGFYLLSVPEFCLFVLKAWKIIFSLLVLTNPLPFHMKADLIGILEVARCPDVLRKV